MSVSYHEYISDKRMSLKSIFHDMVQQHPPFFKAADFLLSTSFSVSSPFFAIVSNTSLTLISALAEVSRKSTFSPHSFARASPSALGTARSSGKSTLLAKRHRGDRKVVKI